MNRYLFFLLLAQSIWASDTVQSFKTQFPNIFQENSEHKPLYSTNGINFFKPSAMLFPKSEEQLVHVVDYYLKLKKLNPEIAPFVVSGGGRKAVDKLYQGWSFDAHAHGEEDSLVINTKDLSGIYEINWEKDYDPHSKEVKVWVKAGTRWREFIDMVNAQNPHDDIYFVPIIAPTGSNISIGGSLASNTHARPSSIVGGFFADTVYAFRMVTTCNGIAGVMHVSRKDKPDLFHGVIGSFGRGGIISAVKVKLQAIPKGYKTITKLRRVKNIEDISTSLINRQKELRLNFNSDHEYFKQAFLSVGALVSSDLEKFLIFETSLEKTDQNKPSLILFESPSIKTYILQNLARCFPRLTEDIMLYYIDIISRNNEAVFYNTPLSNYIFFQDSFTESFDHKNISAHKTAHLTFMMPINNLDLAIRVIKSVSQKDIYKNIAFELQDLLPLPSTKVLMSPAYINKNDQDAQFLAYTISWAINDRNETESLMLKKELEESLHNTLVDGSPLAWLHPLKEWSHKKIRRFYKKQAHDLQNIFDKYQIDDRSIINNKLQDYLYGPVQ